MKNVKVREAKIHDAPHIAEVHVKTWQHAYKGQIPDSYLNSLSIEQRTEGWKKQLESPEKGVYSFVVEVDGRVVGWCTAGFSRDEDAVKEVGEIYGIYIHPDYMRTGLGSQLSNQALNSLRNDGYRKATLWVLITNEKTRKWYEKKGWRVEGKTKTDKRGDVELHEIRYIINL